MVIGSLPFVKHYLGHEWKGSHNPILRGPNDHHGKLLATEPNWDDPPSREYPKRFVGSEVWLVELRFSM